MRNLASISVLDVVRKSLPPSLSPPIPSQGSFWDIIREPFSGAWQRNIEVRRDTVLAYHAVYACVTLISADVGKLGLDLVELQLDGTWKVTTSPAYSPVLTQPNHYQNQQQFMEWWITSKLVRGNTYALKERDARGVVVALHLLDPGRVRPLIAPNGDVYYSLGSDLLAEIPEGLVVPATEIIHDRLNCLYHPLVGIPPLYASGVPAVEGLRIQHNQALFFENLSRPSGILTAPGSISNDTASRLKTQWQENYGGANVGKVAVLGDDLRYESIQLTAAESQLIEQLKWTADVICSTYHVPPFKIGIGTMPTYQNGEVLNQIYYSDCLQSLITAAERTLGDGLGLDTPVGPGQRQLRLRANLDELFRMDTGTMITKLGEGVKNTIFTPNEARLKMNLPPIKGGDALYLQQQNFSLEALARRDALPNPFVIDRPAANPTPSGTGPAATADPTQSPKEFAEALIKGLADLEKAA